MARKRERREDIVDYSYVVDHDTWECVKDDGEALVKTIVTPVWPGSSLLRYLLIADATGTILSLTHRRA